MPLSWMMLRNQGALTNVETWLLFAPLIKIPGYVPGGNAVPTRSHPISPLVTTSLLFSQFNYQKYQWRSRCWNYYFEKHCLTKASCCVFKWKHPYEFGPVFEMVLEVYEATFTTIYRVFHNCWNKAIGHKSRILNDTTMMITFIERWKDNIL